MRRLQSPRRLLPALALLLAAAVAMLVSPRATGQRGRVAEDLGRALSAFDRLSLDPAELLGGARRSGRVTLRTSRGDFELEVEPFDMRSEDYRAVAAGPGGTLTELPRTPSRSWRGAVRGAEATHVRLVLDEEKFSAVIVTPAETFFVEPARNLSAAAGAKEFVFYSGSAVREHAGECGVTLAERVGEEARGALERAGASAAVFDIPALGATFLPKVEARIATEADFEFFQALGGNESAANQDALDILTQADAIYDAQLNIRLRVVFQRVWTVSADPYTPAGADASLFELRTKYNQTFTSAGQTPPARDLVHMFAGKRFINPNGSTSSIVGIAFIASICSGAVNNGYAISLKTTGHTTLHRVALAAHELGHNFGAVHPPASEPGCDTSIMSTIVESVPHFCPYSRDQITSIVLSHGECLTRLAEPGCSYALTTGDMQSFDEVGGTGQVGVAASQPGCVWGMAEGAHWLDASATAAGTATLPFAVAPNTSEGPREGYLEAAGQRVYIVQAPSPACSRSEIVMGQTLAGSLTPSDCRLGLRAQELAPLDLYTFTARAGQRVRIEMNAALRPSGSPVPPEALDAFLLLYNPVGTSVALTSDLGGNPFNTDPAMPVSGFMPLSRSGVYTIVATSDTNNDNGDYTVRLTDNSANSTVSLSSAAYTVEEGTNAGLIGDGFTFRIITVTRAGDTSGAATVDYATADGSASRQKDYTQALGTLVFSPGATSVPFWVFVTDDAFQEGPETVHITLSNPVGATLGANPSATLTINSNDSSTGPSPVRAESFNTAFFVRQQYLDFLNRAPDGPGLAHWMNEIESCGPDQQCREVRRINVSAAFFLSIEFQETGFLAYRFYKAAYGDATSPGVPGTVPVVRQSEFLSDTQRIGLAVVVGNPNWEQRLELNKRDFALEFVLRPRFLAAYPLSMTPAEFVDKLNQNAGFILTQAERDALVAQLRSSLDVAASRAAVLRQVADHASLRQAELNRAFVLMQYFGYLRRNPDDAPEQTLNYAGWRFWLDKLNQFGGNFVHAEMVKAFITSDEYADRFGKRP